MSTPFNSLSWIFMVVVDLLLLLEAALALAVHRVVVKRPHKAPALAGRTPSYAIEGRSTRFDVYALRGFG